MGRGSIAAVVAIFAFWMGAQARQDLKSLVYQAPPEGYSGLEGKSACTTALTPSSLESANTGACPSSRERPAMRARWHSCCPSAALR